jgi:hypothetical protein
MSMNASFAPDIKAGGEVDAGGTISAGLATTNSKWPVVPIDVRTHIGVRLAVVRLSGVVETIV